MYVCECACGWGAHNISPNETRRQGSSGSSQSDRTAPTPAGVENRVTSAGQMAALRCSALRMLGEKAMQSLGPEGQILSSKRP